MTINTSDVHYQAGWNAGYRFVVFGEYDASEAPASGWQREHFLAGYNVGLETAKKERACNGQCDPTCAFCRQAADQAATDRQAEWEGCER